MAILIYGRHPVHEAINNNNVKIVYVLKIEDELAILAKRKNITVKYVNTDFFNKKFKNDNHQNIAAEINDFVFYDFDQLIKKLETKNNNLILLLDEIQDPYNFGAIVRSAVACNADAIIIKKNNQVSINATVIKASAGQVYKIKIILVANLNNAIDRLKQQKFWIVGTSSYGAQDYDNVNYKTNIGLVIGNENSGIQPLLLKNCDFKVKIPMFNNVESLNASVSAGILLYEILRQRRR